jgi:hypothetical protein
MYVVTFLLVKHLGVLQIIRFDGLLCGAFPFVEDAKQRAHMVKFVWYG